MKIYIIYEGFSELALPVGMSQSVAREHIQMLYSLYYPYANIYLDVGHGAVFEMPNIRLIMKCRYQFDDGQPHMCN